MYNAVNFGKLNQTVVDIEFLLISVVQGVALAALAASSAPIIANFQFEYFPYIVSAFLFILIFWSQAIMHVLGFIRWPIDMLHNFLYFLASLVEVIAFSEMTNPLFWFGIIFAFVLVSGILYYYDLLLIKLCKKDLVKTQAGKALYNSLYKEQLFDLKVFVPSGLLFTSVCVYLIYNYSQLFLGQHYHVYLVGVQVLFGLIILAKSLGDFKRRLQLIAANS